MMAATLMNQHLRGPLRRLPEHYKARYLEAQRRIPLPVHHREEKGEFKVLRRSSGVYPMKNFNIPPKIMYPKEADRGLWGGEGIIVGFMKRKELRQKVPRTWSPRLSREIFYSEILDRWMSIIVTQRTQALVEEASGFDNYILQTHEVDLRSRLGMHLKREMLLALTRKSLYPNDPERRDRLLKKYERFIIPEEEAEWVGLTLEEAVKKQLKLEVDEAEAAVRPKKFQHVEELLSGDLETLDSFEEKSSSNIFSRFFSSKSS